MVTKVYSPHYTNRSEKNICCGTIISCCKYALGAVGNTNGSQTVHVGSTRTINHHHANQESQSCVLTVFDSQKGTFYRRESCRASFEIQQLKFCFFGSKSLEMKRFKLTTRCSESQSMRETDVCIVIN